MLNYFKEKKETFFDYKNGIFQSPKTPFFKVVNPFAFGQKMPFFLHLDFIKIRLEIMLSDFAEKKETYFDLKKKRIFQSPKNRTF